MQWAVDQQPYLQGYLAVDSLWLYKTNGNTIGGGQATLTGPAFIDKGNVGCGGEVRRQRHALRYRHDRHTDGDRRGRRPGLAAGRWPPGC